jgi:hypothetical protein
MMAAIQTEFVRSTLQYKILRDNFSLGLAPMDENIYNPFEGAYDFMLEEQSSYSARLGGYRIL